MKIQFRIFLLLLAVSLTAQAQFKQFNLGLRAAPHIGWMKPGVDAYTSDGVKLGFAWGFVCEYNFTENHSIGTGFNVVFNGGHLKYPGKVGAQNVDISRTYNLKCIEIPLSLKMRTNPIGGIKYYGQIGLGTSFNLGSKKADEYDLGSGTVKEDKAAYDEIAFLRESLLLGLGGEYSMKAGTILSAGLAFNNGFTDILTGKNSADSGLKEKATVNFVELNLAVLF